MNRLFGLIGYPLGHSWSKKYFDLKFAEEGIRDAQYQLFPIENIGSISMLLSENPDFAGFNVTIPYKTTIISFLDIIDPVAQKINAVNTVRIEKNNSQILLHGFNTDVYGFEKSIRPLLISEHKAAIILGTGGAAKAAAWVFNKLNIDYVFVSRNPSGNQQIAYNNLSRELFNQHRIIINATPLGMKPDVRTKPPIPYQFIDKQHLLFDMVYNPVLSEFLKEGQRQGATIKNGLEMLQLQAEKSWEIWNHGK